jgi:hypothetical protein
MQLGRQCRMRIHFRDVAAASCRSHRTADKASHLHDVYPRAGALCLLVGYWFAVIHPSPSQHRELTRSARTGRCLCRLCFEKRQCRKRTRLRTLEVRQRWAGRSPGRLRQSGMPNGQSNPSGLARPWTDGRVFPRSYAAIALVGPPF